MAVLSSDFVARGAAVLVAVGSVAAIQAGGVALAGGRPEAPPPSPSKPPPPAPELSVAITDARDQMAVGEETRYIVTLRNEGEKPVKDIVLAQTAPVQLEFLAADENGEIHEGTALWRVSLDPGQEATRTVTARLDEATSDLWRVATTVCAGRESDPAPVVCGTDSNLLPAATQASTANTGSTGLLAPLLAGAAGMAAVVLLAAAGAFLFVLRRRNRERRARAIRVLRDLSDQ
ncbi:DUF11 domain-containing protein [Actinorugispora endophytica]|uniref:Putative repeat protein (TIGR01451 family) n=1 Tax=Actinorugispora endophytica TaxID=1605990 RepID=A0A4R6USC0_9ACTN|nr:DUF11 domain-containing protein [Actinorugispora endophytica]TDQ50001.1 putative repeat protein (TIGR01451 family) [Actinorugispora endophytica]